MNDMTPLQASRIRPVFNWLVYSRIRSFRKSIFLLLIPPVFLVLAKSIEIADRAQAIKAAYNHATFRATPFFLFLLQEQFNRVVTNEFQVLNHAHLKLSSVALIQCLKSFAGKEFTLIAETDASLCKQFALVAHMSAVFTPRNTAGAILSVKASFLELLLHCLLIDAQAAVDTALSDYRLFH